MHVNTDNSANPHESGWNSAPLIERYREPVLIMHFPFSAQSAKTYGVYFARKSNMGHGDWLTRFDQLMTSFDQVMK